VHAYGAPVAVSYPNYHHVTTKNSTIGRVSTVLVTVDTRPISHVYTVHVARNMRITVGRVYLIHANWPRVFNTRGQLFLLNIY
jgi:hypothetical protein